MKKSKHVVKLVIMLVVAALALGVLIIVEQNTEKNYGYVKTVKKAQGVEIKD